jgi:hypothetical protein
MTKCRLCHKTIPNPHRLSRYCGSQGRRGTCSWKVNILTKRLVLIRQRCTNPTHRSYRFYRNVKICGLWKVDTFAFVKWALRNGWQAGLQIDRIKNEIGYTPRNCRFVTGSQNCRNKRNNVTDWKARTRCCSRCRQVKPFADFHISRQEVGGLMYRCKLCQKWIDHQRWTKQKLPGEVTV